MIKGYDLLSIEMVYDKISNYLPKSLTKNIYPKDNLLSDYNIDDEDLEDIMIEIFKQRKIKFPEVKEQEEFYLRNGDETTIEKMINFVNYFKNDNAK